MNLIAKVALLGPAIYLWICALKVSAQSCVDEQQGCANHSTPECLSETGYTGDANTTVTGRQCQRWDSQTPHVHSWTFYPENYCRNPDGDVGPWCYTTDPNSRYELCFPDCAQAAQSCVDEQQGCANHSTPECLSETGYTGYKSTTITGRTCQRWDSQTPHGHIWTFYPENYCRNPDGEPGPWCYTTDPSRRYELCFPDCTQDCVDESRDCANLGSSLCLKNIGYAGTKNITISGITCQRWDSDTPHPNIRNYPHNYCRNPDGEPGPWCYTMDPSVTWELCFTSNCTTEPTGTTMEVQATTTPATTTRETTMQAEATTAPAPTTEPASIASNIPNQMIRIERIQQYSQQKGERVTGSLISSTVVSSVSSCSMSCFTTSGCMGFNIHQSTSTCELFGDGGTVQSDSDYNRYYS